jgi:hypothetical protein
VTETLKGLDQSEKNHKFNMVYMTIWQDVKTNFLYAQDLSPMSSAGRKELLLKETEAVETTVNGHQRPAKV